MPSIRDPLTRALLLAELGPTRGPEHLAIYQDAASTPIPFAVFRYPKSQRAVGAAFLTDGELRSSCPAGSFGRGEAMARGDHEAHDVLACRDRRQRCAPLITLSAFSARRRMACRWYWQTGRCGSGAAT